MFCEKCGREITENMRFCPVCGQKLEVIKSDVQGNTQSETWETAQDDAQSKVWKAPQDNIQRENNEKKTVTEKKPKWMKVILLVLILIVVLAGFGGYMYFTSPLYTIQKDLKEGNVAEAVVEYNYEVAGSRLLEKVTDAILSDYIQTLISEYESGEKEYDVVYELLSTLTGLKSEKLSNAAGEGMVTIQAYMENESVYQEAEELYENGDYADAIEKYKLITEDSEVYEDAQERIEESQTKYKENVLAQTEAPATLEEYENCLKVLENALVILPEDTDILNRQEELNDAYLSLVKSTALENAKSAAEAGDYSLAFEELDKALEKLPDDVELLNQQSSYISEYIDSVIDSADASLEAKEYSQAETIVRDALEVLPGNEELTQKLSEIENAKPVSLSSLTALNGGFEWNEGTPTDSFGNTYSDISNYAIIQGYWYEEEIYSEYRLDGGYKNLTFSIGPHTDIPEEGYGKIQIYADDVLVFCSPEIGRKTDVEYYEIDISNTKYLKIVVSANHNGSSLDGYINCILLMNCMLLK